MRRGSLTIARYQPNEKWVQFCVTRAGEGVVLTPDDLRWLVLTAGPALLAEHAPLPTAREIVPGGRK